jgi:hypothetical protein
MKSFKAEMCVSGGETMTDYDSTLEMVRVASLEVTAGKWHDDAQEPYREIAAGKAQGTVSVHGVNTVSLEIDGLTADQAVRVLKALEPCSCCHDRRVTYDIPSPEVGKAKR